MQQPYQLYKQGSKKEILSTSSACPIYLICVRGAIQFPNRYNTVNHWSDFVNKYSVQSLSHVQLFATPWTVACQASLSFTISQSLLKLMSIVSVMPKPSDPLLSPSPPTLNLSQHQCLFIRANELAFHIRWTMYWSFSNSPSKEYSGLISFRIVWFDLLIAQGTLKSLLQHHSLKESILWCSAFFMV